MATSVPAQGGSGSPDINTMRAQNMAARQLIVANSVDLIQQVNSQTVTNYIAGQAYPINIPVRPVGLLKRFWLEIIATVAQGASETQTKTAFGGCNILSNLTLTDLNNQVRINTTGWHLHFLQSYRRQFAYGAAIANSDPCSIGANWGLMDIPSPLTTSQTLRFYYEVPVAYSDNDLTGSIWVNVVNASMQLQITINPNFFVANTADPTLGVYQSSSTQLGTISSFQVNVYQNSLDQLPVNPQTNTVILPPLDLEYVYLLNSTNSNGLSVGLDQSLPYANWRNFLSTTLVYDNAGVENLGTDVNYIALQSANFTNFFKYGPQMLSLINRLKINDDLPPGVYYIDTRMKPINTLQYGNMQLLFNPSVVSGSSTSTNILIGYESLALQGVMNQAGSIFQS